MSLSAEEIERYARHLVLPNVGGAGQQKLKAATVLVVGAGGLGAPAIQYLAAAGVGRLRIVDDDTVSLSNLQRQVIHATADVGLAKVESAACAVAALNPHVVVEAVQTRFGPDGAGLLDDVTVALDCTDNFATRFALADAAQAARVALVSGAVNRFDGSLTVLAPHLAGNPSYRDLVPEAPPAGSVASCEEAGVMGVATGIVGTLQAAEAIKWITGIGEPLVGRLLLVDPLAMRFDTIAYGKRAPG